MNTGYLQRTVENQNFAENIYEDEIFSWANIEIDPEVNKLVNKTEYEGVNESTIIKVKKILSDDDPDKPEICEDVITKCEWCGVDFQDESRIEPIKDRLFWYYNNLEEVQLAMLVGYGLNLSVADEFDQLVESHENGKRYVCEPVGNRFILKSMKQNQNDKIIETCIVILQH